MASTIVRTENLKKYYPTEKSFISRLLGIYDLVKAVDGINLTVRKGETFGLVGESGCGKSTSGRVILQLEPATEGHIYFKDRDLTALNGNELRELRKEMQMIFQDPQSSLNPRKTIGSILSRPLKKLNLDKKERRDRIYELLNLVKLDTKDINRYPHQFSGGQRQRIGIARALAVEPSFVIADEPVSSLDVSIQASILNLLQRLKEDLDLTLLFIAHNLSVVRYVTDRVAIMYLGRILEFAETDELFNEPKHPYTQALLSAAPVPDPSAPHDPTTLPGSVPSPINLPSGCRFHPRCPADQIDKCSEEEPSLKEVEEGHYVSCHLMEP